MQEDKLFREHFWVKCTALLLFSALMTLSLAPIRVFNWWNVTILWVAAYVVLTKGWNPKAIPIDSDIKPLNEPFREHWTVKTVSLIIYTILVITAAARRKNVPVSTTITILFTAFVVIGLVWKPKKKFGPREVAHADLGLEKE